MPPLPSETAMMVDSEIPQQPVRMQTAFRCTCTQHAPTESCYASSASLKTFPLRRARQECVPLNFAPRCILQLCLQQQQEPQPHRSKECTLALLFQVFINVQVVLFLLICVALEP